MTFYQELQLNQAGSRNVVKAARGIGPKCYHALIYGVKIALTLGFCMAFVMAYSALFGADNSITGVAVLLCVMVFRFADFGYHTPHALGALAVIFVVMAFGPRAANGLGAFPGFLINAGCMFLLLFLGCHNVILSNHSTLVLGYLLLYGYDVDGQAYLRRIWGLALGAVLTGMVFYRNHRKKTYKRDGRSLLKEFSLQSMRTRWQLTVTFGVASVLFAGRCLGAPRAMWAGIAVMSVLLPFRNDLKERVRGRILGNLTGGLLFVLLYLFLPATARPFIGILGGIGVGLSVSYQSQAVFNSLGAMAIAASVLSLPGAVFFRIFHNLAGALYGSAVHWLADKLWEWPDMGKKRKKCHVS